MTGKLVTMAMKSNGALGRLVLKVSGTRAFLKVAPAIVPRLDRAVHAMTGGRATMSGGMVPTLLLTATGAKSGEPRTAPLATMPENGSFYLVGSNFGREHHPAWTANLIANPDASVSYRGATIRVRAHRMTPAELVEVWPRLVTFWPNYDKYVELSGRELRIFRLDPR